MLHAGFVQNMFFENTSYSEELENIQPHQKLYPSNSCYLWEQMQKIPNHKRDIPKIWCIPQIPNSIMLSGQWQCNSQRIGHGGKNTNAGVRPHAHQTRREKRSKLGGANPIVATGLFTLQATSNVWCNKQQNGTWLHFFTLGHALHPVCMGPETTFSQDTNSDPLNVLLREKKMFWIFGGWGGMVSLWYKKMSCLHHWSCLNESNQNIWKEKPAC